MLPINKYIDQLNVPAPELSDIENDEFEETWAKRPRLDNSYDHNENNLVGTRKSILNLHGLDDERYISKKVSVKDVFDDEGIVGLSSSFAYNNKETSDVDDNSDNMNEYVDDVEYKSEESSASSYNEDVEGEDAGGSETEQGDNVVVLKSDKMDFGKEENVRHQFLIYDKLMQLQIKLHAALRHFNRLPRGDLACDLFENSTHETQNVVRRAKKKTKHLMEKLVELEDTLLSTSKQTNKIMTEDQGIEEDFDSANEEIESSDDEDNAEHVEEKFVSESQKNAKIKNKRKISTTKWKNNMDTEFNTRENRFRPFRNSTIAKWDERTKFVNVLPSKNAKKDFSKFDSLVLKQIERIMTEKHRLIKRTQLNRSDIERIGSEVEATYDAEIFDDNDFYQQLLRDIIEKKSALTVDPIEMSRQWLEVQNLRQKRSKRKNVDTKASKGRKTRYVVIPQLINFFPSIPESVDWNHESRDQLNRSLFT